MMGEIIVIASLVYLAFYNVELTVCWMMEQDAKDVIVVAIRFLLLLFIGVASWTLMSLCLQFDDGNEEALRYQSLND